MDRMVLWFCGKAVALVAVAPPSRPDWGSKAGNFCHFFKPSGLSAGCLGYISSLLPHFLAQMFRMAEGHFLSIAEQVAAHLRGELLRGRWRGTIPGLRPLSVELEVNSKTVEVALRLLEKEGLLVGQGARRQRRIVLPSGATAVRALRVGILLGENGDRQLDYILDLRHRLVEAGHFPFFAPKSLIDLKMGVPRIARMVRKTEADAWVVIAGSREVLEWFSAQPQPAIGLFGRGARVDLAMAASDMRPAFAAVGRRLAELGHRRWHRHVRPGRPGPVD